jgi:lysophospholipase L1-like esterase
MVCLVVACASRPHAATYPSPQAASAPSSKWESAIVAFEKQDQKTPPPQHPILFVGSSTIRIWKVNEAFPDQPVLNRGFGGSEIDDVNQYFDRVVARYQPRKIIFYSGDNDLAAGRSVDCVVDDMRQFIDMVRQKCPGTKLVVIAIKPSIARWKLIDKIREANQQIEKLVGAYPGGVVVNVESKLLGADGKPIRDLFRVDGLHLSAKGYEILNDAVRQYVTR